MKPLSVLLAVVAFCASIGVISWMSRSQVPKLPVDSEKEEEVEENPFRISKSGPQPLAVVDEPVYEFGKMIMGEKSRHAFVIRNEGDAPLTLTLKKSTCKCTVPTLPEEAIPPGGSAEVILDWETKSISEAYTQHAILWTNDPEHEEILIRIRGDVAPLVQVRPPFPWTIGNIKEDGETTFSGLIMSGQESFQVLGIETTQPWMTAEVHPMTPVDLEMFKSAFGSGYKVVVSIQPKMVIGRFEESITIRTDIDNGHVVSGPVTGTRAGSFSIIGPSWQGSDMTLGMGTVDKSAGKTVKLSLFTGREDDPLQIESLQVVPNIVEVTLQRDDSLQTPVREKYDLTFTIPPDARQGRFYDQDSIHVNITTNRAEMEEINLSIEADIR